MSETLPQLPELPQEQALQLPPPGADDSIARLPHGGFWSRPAVANSAGWITSILIHALIILLGLSLLIKRVEVKPLVQEQNIIPSSELAEETAGGIPNPGMNNDASRAVAQSIDANVMQSDSWAERKSQNLSQTLNSVSTNNDAFAAPVGKTQASGLPSQGSSLAKFGVPGGGQGIGPKGAVFGNGGNAYKIVFVCDASGSMIGRWEILSKELRTTVGKLKPKQSFNVILFSDNTFLAFDKTKLVEATDGNKAKLDAFLGKINTIGLTKVEEGIEAAMKLRPDLVYVLVDPQFFSTMNVTRDAEGTFANLIRTAKGNQNMKINFIMFHRDASGKTKPEFQSAIQTLSKLAREFGGSFNNVSMEDFLGR